MIKTHYSDKSKTPYRQELPNLISVQLYSYKWFLEEGLKELFHDFSPIYDFTNQQFVEMLDYTLGEPKYSLEECRDRDMTFEVPIRAKVRYGRVEGGVPMEITESEVYLGDLPLMTDKGTFIINGRERVVVSQLIRSSGVYFENVFDKIFRKGAPTGVWLETFLAHKNIFGAKVIPNEGPWIEVDTASDDVVKVKIGQGKPIFITTLLRALNSFDEAHQPLYMPLKDAVNRMYEGAVSTGFADVVDETTGEITREPIENEKIEDYYKTAPLLDMADVVNSSNGMVLSVGDRITAEFLDGLSEDVLQKEVAISSAADTNEDILRLFGEPVELSNPTREDLFRKDFENEAGWGMWTLEPVQIGASKIDAWSYISEPLAKSIADYGVANIRLMKVPALVTATLVDEIQAFEEDKAKNSRKRDAGTAAMNSRWALMHIYSKMRPGDPATDESAKSLIHSQFYDNRRYDLARVGRYKLNRKLNIHMGLDIRTITKEDFVAIIKYLVELCNTQGEVDEIDHLKNKRVRAVGELLQSQLRNGFLRMEKVAKERMTAQDAEVIPQVILAIKPVSAAIKSFFGSSQLSQFMDQTNPLSELTHKRRLSALGPGGLTRQSATLEVRDVHDSHYGRICPIETPEGPNIGLISQLATYARVNEFGFIETPYRVVEDGKVQDEVIYLSAELDENRRIAPGDTRVDSKGHLKDDMVQVRHLNNPETIYPVVKKNLVDLMDVAPVQLVSIASALIPFLENDDATRALMGSNMQKQAVPLLRSEAPLVKTGFEGRAARDSGVMIIARNSGVVRSVTSDMICIMNTNGAIDRYAVINNMQSNQSTCVSQRPVVFPGQRVRAGQLLADGPCTDNGELALGKNLLVAFVPWNGYNYEDAILVSQRMVRDDVYSSIHMERYEVEARDTKLGPEEITRDIPNVSEDALKDLDQNGIICIGAQVRPEDLLVGKVQPKGQSELTAEERLIIAIFGKKAEETRDVSLKLPHGEKGKVVDVKVFSRYNYRCKSCHEITQLSKKPEDTVLCQKCGGDVEKQPSDELPAGVNMLVRVYIAQKRKVMEGDKMAGRHGNKGVISKILPDEDMPFLPDGTPVDIVLNPLGVPSRMNIGQIMETHQGWPGHFFETSYANPAFQGANEKEILKELGRMACSMRETVLRNYLGQELGIILPEIQHEEGVSEADALRDATINALKGTSPEHLMKIAEMVDAAPELSPLLMNETGVTPSVNSVQLDSDKTAAADYNAEALDDLWRKIEKNTWRRCGVDEKTGKCIVRDGQTGVEFDNPLTVGYIYMLKLHHLVDDKIHARSTGPYSLVTQQPLGGKAQFGGQRFGEMEVWALEAYGAANTLQEMLTLKSDDVVGRVKVYEAIVKGEPMNEPGIPESFKILVKELQSLGLKVSVFDHQDKELSLQDEEDADSMTRRPLTANDLRGGLAQ